MLPVTWFYSFLNDRKKQISYMVWYQTFQLLVLEGKCSGGYGSCFEIDFSIRQAGLQFCSNWHHCFISHQNGIVLIWHIVVVGLVAKSHLKVYQPHFKAYLRVITQLSLCVVMEFELTLLVFCFLFPLLWFLLYKPKEFTSNVNKDKKKRHLYQGTRN